MANISDDLEAELHEFMGEMREFKNTTERRLANQGTAIDNIRDKVAQVASSPVCVFHAEMLAEQKAQRERDLKQDGDISDLKVKDAVIEYRLSPSEKRQLNIASVGSLIGVAGWAISFILRTFFHIEV